MLPCFSRRLETQILLEDSEGLVRILFNRSGYGLKEVRFNTTNVKNMHLHWQVSQHTLNRNKVPKTGDEEGWLVVRMSYKPGPCQA